jgi:hypothetical protein
MNSGEGADEALTQVALLKLYRELPDSAFSIWARAAKEAGEVAGVSAGGIAAGAGGLAAAPGAKELLKEVLEGRKQVGGGWGRRVGKGSSWKGRNEA